MGEAKRPEGMWFGRTRARCFAMLQAPRADSKRGVIFCNALGYDGLIVYRALRDLANDAVEQGNWALRFDYEGEGDSAGGSWESDRFEAWIESIDDAVAVLRTRGVTDIRLVGFRTGASLAYVYATTHPGISGVAMWWPCVSGSSYVRELRALSRLSNAARPVQRVKADRFPEDSLEVCGFEFTAGTLGEIGGLDLVARPAPVSVPSVLLIDRHDAPPSELLVRRLVDAGTHVEHEQMPGYAEFMIDEGDKSVLPRPVLQRITDWLATTHHVAADPDALKDREPRVVESAKLLVDDPTAGRFPAPGSRHNPVTEQQFWIDDRLFAIVSSPTDNRAIRRVAIVLCTAGSNSRIGPGRLHVDVARYWAGLGFTVVRIDLGGIGDSVGVAPPVENHTYAPIRNLELDEAVEWVRCHTGFDSVVLFGLCSGAFNAYHAAIEGAAISHVLLVNPAIFYLGADDTAGMSAEAKLSAAHALSRGLTSPRKWRLVFREQSFGQGVKRARHLLREGATDGARHVVGAVIRNTARRVGLRVSAPSALPEDLEKITARGVKVLMIFSAGEAAAHYVRVFAGAELEPLLRRGVDLIEIDGGDHIFSPPGARQRLFEETTNYLEREYQLAAIPETAVVPDAAL